MALLGRDMDLLHSAPDTPPPLSSSSPPTLLYFVLSVASVGVLQYCNTHHLPPLSHLHTLTSPLLSLLLLQRCYNANLFVLLSHNTTYIAIFCSASVAGWHYNAGPSPTLFNCSYHCSHLQCNLILWRHLRQTPPMHLSW